MIHALFNQRTQQALEFALDACSARAQLIAHNIANADTPNYKAQRLRFEEFLAGKIGDLSGSTEIELRRTNELHLRGRSSHGLTGTLTPAGLIFTDSQTTYRLDANNIDIDQEMAEQAENALMYSALTELLSRRLAGLRSAISEGRR
jgi:flagellar basal-body rod protein FlgB